MTLPVFSGLVAGSGEASNRALEIGKAGEHLVCANLILAGYRAFLSDQGLPYDVIVDFENRLFRIQVKSTLAPVNVNSASRKPRFCYSFHVRRRGVNGDKQLSDEDCDIVALVALDIGIIAYVPVFNCFQTIQLSSPKYQKNLKASIFKSYDPIDMHPFGFALVGFML